MSKLYDSEIELAVLDCLITWYGETKSYIPAILPDDFHYANARDLFCDIRKFHEESDSQSDNVFDFVMFGNFTKKKHTETLRQVLGFASTTANFNSYLTRLKEMALARRLEGNVFEMLAGQEGLTLNGLQQLVDRENEGLYTKSYTDKAKSDLQSYIDNIGKPKERIKTGFSILDRITGGLRLPSVMMLGAYPSVGKTAFALNVSAAQSEPVVFFSLEMSSEMIFERMAAAIGKIDYSLFSSQRLSDTQKKDILTISESLKDRQFYVFDDIYDIETQYSVVADIKPRLVVVDYIQKVRTGKKTDNRRNEIDYISGMYKQIAKHNKCAVMILSQISRVERDRPTMASLKESGALEADGDYVGILNRPYVLNKSDSECRPEDAYILIDKNKFGQTGELKLFFKGEHQRFYETELDSENPFI